MKKAGKTICLIGLIFTDYSVFAPVIEAFLF